ncbi:adenine deaminase [Evansella vedderi]|uniref:Adenine deaminase n=1 Tax=Evansella vedderi TaxID=38282 RepID=A0ABT9ZUE8_9BACI|nr:adenine deaminase [Evansella vedderi]MDQ0254863.1 adenine deaminase [Evansella vedderi]
MKGTTTIEQLRRRIAVAGRNHPADLVIKNGKIIDIFNLEILDHNQIAIVDGTIAAIGPGPYEGNHIIDANGSYIAPGFIDGHVHIESSMVTPTEFAKVVLPHGVTTVITDPHEIANVSGSKGIQFMLQDAENTLLDIFFMLPSSVPATSFENAGAVLKANDLEPLFSHPKVIGLAEVMDFPAVRNNDEQMIHKLITAANHTNNIDGHAAGLDLHGINIYRAASIKTDHECITAEEAKERLRRGMYIMIREGSTAKNLEALIPVVHKGNSRRCFFCTDDKHLDDLMNEGSINHNIRLAIKQGLDPIIAIQMATLNAAECYELNTKGAIAPGYAADMVFLDDLKKIKILKVLKEGKIIAENGKLLQKVNMQPSTSTALTNTVILPEITEKHLQIPIKDPNKAIMIGIIPNQIITKKLLEKVEITAEGHFIASIQKDQCKMAVIERHKRTGNIGLGIVKGLGLKKGAIATTVAHDSHNLIVAGTNDKDMLKAISEINKMKGGLVVIKEGKAIGSIPLEIAGLISKKDYETVNNELQALHDALHEISPNTGFNQFLTLSFLSLPVIPDLKLTDTGLFDVVQFKHI